MLIVPGGSGSEMLNGWNVTVQNYKSPWQVPGRPVGLGKTGIKKIVSFLRKGGRYIGISSGGGSLACRELGGFADVTIADHGLGQARIYMHSEAPNHPVMLGYDGHRDQEGNWHEREIPSFYFCEQLWPRMEDFSGRVFKTGAKSTALASFTHADYELWTENMERDPVSLNREHAAIVYQRVGKGSLVLFGTNLGFRAQWISNYRFFSNLFTPGTCASVRSITARRPGAKPPMPKLSARALELHNSSVVVDLHHDIAMDVLARRELGEEGVLRRVWLPRLREAGIKVQVFPIFIDSAFLPEMALRRELGARQPPPRRN